MYKTQAPVSICLIAQSMWGFTLPCKSCIFSTSISPTDECKQSHPLLAPQSGRAGIAPIQPHCCRVCFIPPQAFLVFPPLSLSLLFVVGSVIANQGSVFQSGRQMNVREELEGVQIESGIRSWHAGATLRQSRPVAAKESGHFLEFGKRKADWVHAAKHSLSAGGCPCRLIFNLYCGPFYNHSLLDL